MILNPSITRKVLSKRTAEFEINWKENKSLLNTQRKEEPTRLTVHETSCCYMWYPNGYHESNNFQCRSSPCSSRKFDAAYSSSQKINRCWCSRFRMKLLENLKKMQPSAHLQCATTISYMAMETWHSQEFWGTINFSKRNPVSDSSTANNYKHNCKLQPYKITKQLSISQFCFDMKYKMKSAFTAESGWIYTILIVEGSRPTNIKGRQEL